MANSKVHECQNVLNPLYVPVEQEDIELFNKNQEFMFAVFNRMLKTTEGKSIVRKHVKNGDAQAVFAEMLTHASQSMQAEVDAQTCLRWLTTGRLITSQWRGSAYDFVRHSQERLCIYQEHT